MILLRLKMKAWMAKVAKRNMALLLLLFSALSLLAAPVSEGEARQKARLFLQEHGKKADALSQHVKKSRSRSGSNSTTSASYYVFNLGEDNGFVIVSGDDRTAAILGYADCGSIGDDMPDGLRYMLDGYEEQIALLGDDAQTGSSKRAVPLTRGGLGAIEPLLTTQWSQGAPYNNLCPAIGDEHAVTGCVATTLAQLLYYHYAHSSFAAASTAIPGYSFTTRNKAKEAVNLTVADLPATSFDWASMTTTYTKNSTGAAANAVAKLMQYCGASLQMVYGLSANGGSSAYGENIPYALKTCFGFDGGIQHCYRQNYSYDAWVGMIYSELTASRPVALGGQSCGGGHSFLCDGYKYENDADYFHINWGWGGVSDGYFLLTLLNPYEQGAGGSSTLDGFSFGQDAVIGIQPPVAGNADYCLSLETLSLGPSDVSASSKTFTRSSVEEAFTGIGLTYKVYAYYLVPTAFDVALQLVNGSGEVVHTLDDQKNQTKAWNEYFNGTPTVTIPASVGNGTYYIKVMSRPTGTTDWQECYDGNAYQLTAVIAGNELTISVPIPANVLPDATLAVTGDKIIGHEQTVTATITGGSGPYNGNVVLSAGGTFVMGTIVNVAAGETKNVQFTFIPQYGGTNELALYNNIRSTTQIGTKTTVDITLLLDNDAINVDKIKTNKSNVTDVLLDHRTLYKDGKWNTICLPFNVTIAGSPLAGAEARTLRSSSYSGGSLTVNFSDPVDALQAGTPYIIKWPKAVGYDEADPATRDIVNPVFTGVTIEEMEYHNVETTCVDFCGRYDYWKMTEDNSSILFVAGANKLYWPKAGASLGACRAYFQLKGGLTAGSISAARIAFDEPTQTTSLREEGIVKSERLRVGDGTSGMEFASAAEWYTLDGMKLSGKPTAKGIYVKNGRRVVVP